MSLGWSTRPWPLLFLLRSFSIPQRKHGACRGPERAAGQWCYCLVSLRVRWPVFVLVLVVVAVVVVAGVGVDSVVVMVSVVAVVVVLTVVGWCWVLRVCVVLWCGG